MELSTWQDQISMWYEHRKHDQVGKLETILYQAPDEVFGPKLCERQSKAIACWLDGCLRVFQHARYHNHQKPTKPCSTQVQNWNKLRVRYQPILRLRTGV